MEKQLHDSPIAAAALALSPQSALSALELPSGLAPLAALGLTGGSISERPLACGSPVESVPGPGAAIPRRSPRALGRSVAERVANLGRRLVECALEVAVTASGEVLAQRRGALAKRRVLLVPLRAIGHLGRELALARLSGRQVATCLL